MRSRSLINLGIIILILSINWCVSDETKKEILAQPITSIKASEIYSIKIIHRDSLLTLNKQGNEWHIEGTSHVVKNKILVEQLLTISQFKSYEDYSINKLNLSSLELDPALAQIRINETDIKFGAIETISGYRYIQVGKRVYMVRDIGLALFNIQAHHLTQEPQAQ